MKKVLFVVTNHEQMGNLDQKTGWFLPEVAHPYKILTEAGFDIDFVSPKGGLAPVDPSSLENRDDVSSEFLDSDAYQLTQDTGKPEDVDYKQYQAIFYAGGHGTMWDFPDSKPLAQMAANIYENGGVVAAVCHGPAGLVNITLTNGEYLVAGKEVACFTNQEEAAVGKTDVMPFLLESKLLERGSSVKTAADWQENVIVSDRVVTGQNPASAAGVGKAMLDLINN